MNILRHDVFPDAEPYRIFTFLNEVTTVPMIWQPFRMGFFEVPKQLKLVSPAVDDPFARNRLFWAHFMNDGQAPPGAPAYIVKAASIMVRINSNPEETKMLDLAEKYEAVRESQINYAVTEREVVMVTDLLWLGVAFEAVRQASQLKPEVLESLRQQIELGKQQQGAVVA
jgi:hypothetical protein